ncbi:AI-2E family transporter [bacterium]|nr:AI-2E family transporter [bacterium]
MRTHEKYPVLAAIAVCLLTVVFLWSTRSVLSPILVGGLLFYLLTEMKDFELARKLRTGIGIILGVWILANAQGIVVPFLIAFVLAYLFNPMVDFFERRRWPRLVGVTVVFAVLFGGLGFLAVLVIPDLVREIQDLIVRLPRMIQGAISLAHQHLPKLFGVLQIDYAKVEEDFLVRRYPAKVEELMIGFLRGLSGMGTWLTRLLNVILIPVLTFYFLKDYGRMKSGLIGYVPRRYKSLANFYFWRSNRIVGGYLRGQLIVCAVVGVLTWFGLFLFRNPYAVMIGIVTGILNIVPYVGLYVSLGVALLSSPFSPHPLWAALQIAGVFLVVQSLEAWVISPKIVGDRVGLHPVVVIFSILIFSRFLGFWGLLLAVPVAALLNFMINEWNRHRNWKEMLAEKKQSSKT